MGKKHKQDGWGVSMKCFETHSALVLPGPKKHQIWGGSCSQPVVQGADVYIGFCTTMRFSRQHWPWTPGHELLYAITDGAAPKDPDSFKKLVDWTMEQLAEGAKVHCGCIGGHGRTGTFLSALVAMYGEPDAITYVRKHYCKKVVESKAQVEFLHTHFGVKKVGASKTHYEPGYAYPAPRKKLETPSGWGSSHKLPPPKRDEASSSLGSYAFESANTKYDGLYEPLAGSSVWGD